MLIKDVSLIPGKAYDSMDEAAVNAVLHAMKGTARDDREWGGFVYQTGTTFSYGAPKHGRATVVDERFFTPVPHGSLIVADYHTHHLPPAEWEWGDEHRSILPFSPEDEESYELNHRTGYLGVLDGKRLWKGRVWRLVPGKHESDSLLVIKY